MTFVEGDVLMVRDGRFVGVPRDEAERLAASRTPEQVALQDRLLAQFAGEAAEMRAAHDAIPEDSRMAEVNPFPQGTRLHEMMQDALGALADFPYTGPMPEEHVCDFGELVGPVSVRAPLVRRHPVQHARIRTPPPARVDDQPTPSSAGRGRGVTRWIGRCESGE